MLNMLKTLLKYCIKLVGCFYSRFSDILVQFEEFSTFFLVFFSSFILYYTDK